MKALTIIGIIFSGIFILWYLLMVSSDGAISVKEFAPVALLFGGYSLAVFIVGLIKSRKK